VLWIPNQVWDDNVMSNLQKIALLFKDQESKIGEIVVDAFLQETHEMRAKATEHPVEDGTSVVDHVQLQPTTLQIEGVVSNTPLDFIGMPIISAIGGDNDHAQKTFEKLEKLFADRQPITIATTLKSYKNMVLENISIQRNAKTSGALRFSCSAKQIQFANQMLIHIPNPKVARAQPKQKTGKQPATKAKPQVEKKSRSLLAALFGETG
jgi:hypothetical protein